MTTISTTHGPSRMTRAVWLGLGSFFAALTGRVLLWDVSGFEDVTPEHALTVGALVGAIASGVYFWHMLRAVKLMTALGLGIAFAGATLYCMIGSAGRGDEQTFHKNAEVRQLNAERARTQRTLDEAKRRYDTALDAETAECASGAGARCKARRETTANLRADREAAEVTLRSLPPEGRENGKLKRAAELLAFFVTGDHANTERGLALLWPFIPPLVCELLTIVFLHLGFAVHVTVARKLTVATTIPAQPAETEETEPRKPSNPRKPNGGNRLRSMTKAETERFVVTELALRGSLPSQDWLADKAGVRKSTAHKWLTEWEDKGLITRSRAGKCKVIEAV